MDVVIGICSTCDMSVDSAPHWGSEANRRGCSNGPPPGRMDTQIRRHVGHIMTVEWRRLADGISVQNAQTKCARNVS